MSAALLEAPAAVERESVAHAATVAPSLFLALPSRPGGRAEHEIAKPKPSLRPGFKTHVGFSAGSLLCLNFNILWARAMNRRRTENVRHFAMRHDDIDAPAGWGDALIDISEATGADVVSSVIAIKDGRGLTSTAVHCNVTGTMRRLTMAELHALPETFDLGDLVAAGIATGAPSETLMVNTGLWVCRLGEWVESFPGFRNMYDGVSRTADGVFVPGNFPEDWSFSLWCRRAGLKVVATRKVPVAHMNGDRAYRNDHVWGTCATDPGDVAKA